MEFEAEELPHRAPVSFRKPLECPVDVYTLVLAYTQRSGVHISHAGACPKQHLLDKLISTARGKSTERCNSTNRL